MRYTTILTVLSLTFSGAMASKSFGPFGFFGPWFDPELDIAALEDFKFPENPCEFIGGTCEATGTGFCTAKGDISIASFPCGTTGTVKVGCCWHEGTTNAWFEQWKEWIETRRLT